MLNPQITIVIADDHPLMLSGLHDELVSAGYQVVGSAKNGAQALELIVAHQPMVAILDIEMPLLSGFEVMKIGSPKSPETQFIVMTYHKEKGFLVQAKKFGAKGYLLKDAGITEITICIQTILKRELYYSDSLEKGIKSSIDLQLKIIKQLTPTERTIIRHIAMDKSSLEIAEQLSTSPRTVQKHRTNIIAKLNTSHQEITSLQLWAEEHKDLLILL
ncbi:response regulator transcription factor [Flavobacteriaceae bacterium KMM 6898]|nr:response regulator transcription factor [Flavobacteriaceae bacterium KMM 6898]